jgi:hypothetical protein
MWLLKVGSLTSETGRDLEGEGLRRPRKNTKTLKKRVDVTAEIRTEIPDRYRYTIQIVLRGADINGR